MKKDTKKDWYKDWKNHPDRLPDGTKMALMYIGMSVFAGETPRVVPFRGGFWHIEPMPKGVFPKQHVQIQTAVVKSMESRGLIERAYETNTTYRDTRKITEDGSRFGLYFARERGAIPIDE